MNKSGYSRMLEIIACKKLHMKEMYNFRQNMDTMLDNSEESLHKVGHAILTSRIGLVLPFYGPIKSLQ